MLIVERSPLVTRDLDLLTEINQRAWVGVVFSLSNLDAKLKHAFEPHSPGLQRRLQAMVELASAGILTGTTLMPIIPFAGDDRRHLEEVVRATKDHGGSFVLAGGLTMELAQADTYRVWAYRKAAWAVDECAESIAEIYQRNGEAGLQKLPDVGKSVAVEIGKWLKT